MLIPSNALTTADRSLAIIRNPSIVSPNTSVMATIAQMNGCPPVCYAASKADMVVEVLHSKVRSSCVLVVADNQLLGIFTERDAVCLHSQMRSLENLAIAEVMTHPVITLQESAFTDIFLAVNLLQQNQIRHLPLLNEQNQIVGLVTYESLLQLSHRQVLRLEAEKLELLDNHHTGERRYAALAATAPVGICRTDAVGNFLYVNERWCKITGMTPESTANNGWIDCIHPEDQEVVIQEWSDAVGKNRPFRLEYRIQRTDGTQTWVFGQAVAEYDSTGNITGYVRTITDISQRRTVLRDRQQVETQLIYDALHDPVTSLPNRNLLINRLELAINRARRVESYGYAVLFLDMDRFKIINDSLGHTVGDQLLKIIAQKITTKIRKVDLAARLGSDEFVILLENIKGVQDAIYVAERILAEFQTPLMLNGYEVLITTSIGIVLSTTDYQQASDLIRDSDIAMYRAKEQGRNCYKIFNAQMYNQALTRLNLESDLRKAIERQEFIVYYQPIFDLNCSHLIGFEALVRWQHPTRGFVSPGEFVPIAEETGLIVAIDHWVLNQACQQLATWQTQFSRQFPLKVSVNLSVQDLRKITIVADVAKILHRTGLDGHCLTLEITESMLIENITETIKVLEQLKALGIQISIDDFGTGYSSLNYLHRLPADTLKIDRSFIKQMQEGDRNCQVVKTIITLSNQLGLAVVAEGIETQQQLEFLQYLGCEFGQGYLFSQPLSVHEVEILLQREIIRCHPV